jgi:hypothetical protein
MWAGCPTEKENSADPVPQEDSYSLGASPVSTLSIHMVGVGHRKGRYSTVVDAGSTKT